MHCGFVRAKRNIDYAPHGTVKKGELGIIVGDDGHVRWMKKHRRMSDWGNQTFPETDDIERIRSPLIVTRWQMATVGFVFCGLLLAAYLLPVPEPAHHWLFHRDGGNAAERRYMQRDPPHFIERVVDGANGSTWLVTFERIKGHHMRVATRYELTPAQVDVELRRLDAP
jgi:hypothetical protein